MRSAIMTLSIMFAAAIISFLAAKATGSPDAKWIALGGTVLTVFLLLAGIAAKNSRKG